MIRILISKDCQTLPGTAAYLTRHYHLESNKPFLHLQAESIPRLAQLFFEKSPWIGNHQDTQLATVHAIRFHPSRGTAQRPVGLEELESFWKTYQAKGDVSIEYFI